MIRLNDILDQVTSYHPEADVSLIEKAYVYSAKAHAGQVRLSGEPYLMHPLFTILSKILRPAWRI
jgi:GTP pyrophosphokinase